MRSGSSFSWSGLLTVLLLLCAAGISYATDINATFPCATGNILVSGAFDPLTTVFSLNFDFNDCVQDNDVTNGSVAASGTIDVLTGAMNITSQTALTITLEGTPDSVTLNCTQNIVGTYNFSTEILNGSFNNSCEGQGSAKISLLEMFLKVFP